MDIENCFPICSALSTRPTAASSTEDRESSQMTTTRKRTSFTEWQLSLLEQRFLRQSYLTREERVQLGIQLSLTERQVMLWFQNRRARLKKQGIRDTAYSLKVLQIQNTGLMQEEDGRPYPMLTAMLQSSTYVNCNATQTTFSTIDQQQPNSFHQIASPNYTTFQQSTGFH